MIKNLNKNSAYRANTYGRFLSLVKQLRNGSLKDQLILIDGVYVRIFFSENYRTTMIIDRKIIDYWVSRDFRDQDFCITIFEDFFDLRDTGAQLFLLARAVGYYKLNDLVIPQYGVEKRRLEALKQLDVIEEDLVADQFAANVVKLNVYYPRKIMRDIAEYFDRVFENPQGALEWRLRSKYVK